MKGLLSSVNTVKLCTYFLYWTHPLPWYLFARPYIIILLRISTPGYALLNAHHHTALGWPHPLLPKFLEFSIKTIHLLNLHKLATQYHNTSSCGDFNPLNPELNPICYLLAVGRTPLDEWSARRRDLYLTTHDISSLRVKFCNCLAAKSGMSF